jgi:hypothetical protein
MALIGQRVVGRQIDIQSESTATKFDYAVAK